MSPSIDCSVAGSPCIHIGAGETGVYLRQGQELQFKDTTARSITCERTIDGQTFCTISVDYDLPAAVRAPIWPMSMRGGGLVGLGVACGIFAALTVTRRRRARR